MKRWAVILVTYFMLNYYFDGKSRRMGRGQTNPVICFWMSWFWAHLMNMKILWHELTLEKVFIFTNAKYALFRLDGVKSPFSISLQTLLSKSAHSEQILEISWSRSLLEWHLCFLSWLAVFSHARKTMVHLLLFHSHSHVSWESLLVKSKKMNHSSPDVPYMWNLQSHNINELICKRKTCSQTYRMTLGLLRGKNGRKR